MILSLESYVSKNFGIFEKKYYWNRTTKYFCIKKKKQFHTFLIRRNWTKSNFLDVDWWLKLKKELTSVRVLTHNKSRGTAYSRRVKIGVEPCDETIAQLTTWFQEKETSWEKRFGASFWAMFSILVLAPPPSLINKFRSVWPWSASEVAVLATIRRSGFGSCRKRRNVLKAKRTRNGKLFSKRDAFLLLLQFSALRPLFYWFKLIAVRRHKEN